MGIDIHALNFLTLQARQASLGHVLTIGRQSLSLPPQLIKARFDRAFDGEDGYCEALLRALSATKVDSLDFSDYEKATYVADLNRPVSLGRQFDTLVDAGSLEHIFDVAAAFRNLGSLCKVGGRIVHILPVNNLSGHGFWQFSSDLLYSVYSEKNGFGDTEVFYASSLDFGVWYRPPKAVRGRRVEVVSVEPLILLCVTSKQAEGRYMDAVQPFYLHAWDRGAPESLQINQKTDSLRKSIRRQLARHTTFANALRNILLMAGLATGLSRFSVRHSRFKRLLVADLLRGAMN